MREVILETDRLLLRMWREEDFKNYAQICANTEMMRYLANGRLLTRPEAWRRLAFLLGHWQLQGYGLGHGG